MTIKPDQFHSIGSSRLIGWLVATLLSGIVLLASISADVKNRKITCLQKVNAEFVDNECKIKEKRNG